MTRKSIGLASVTPRQVLGFGRALDALERLPALTPGKRVACTIVLSGGDESYRESNYRGFAITDSCLSLSSGDSAYDREVGGDNYVGHSTGAWTHWARDVLGR